MIIRDSCYGILERDAIYIESLAYWCRIKRYDGIVIVILYGINQFENN